MEAQDTAHNEHDALHPERTADPNEQHAGLDGHAGLDEQHAALNEQDAGLDEQERIEAAWLLAREEDPHAPSPSTEAAREYALLEELLATLPLRILEDGWQETVLRAASKL